MLISVSNGLEEGTYDFANAGEVDAVLTPDVLILISLDTRLSESSEQLAKILDVNVTPATLASSDSHTVALLESHLGQARDLNTALVDRALALAKDDGRPDEGGLDGG